MAQPTEAVRSRARAEGEMTFIASNCLWKRWGSSRTPSLNPSPCELPVSSFRSIGNILIGSPQRARRACARLIPATRPPPTTAMPPGLRAVATTPTSVQPGGRAARARSCCLTLRRREPGKDGDQGRGNDNLFLRGGRGAAESDGRADRGQWPATTAAGAACMATPEGRDGLATTPAGVFWSLRQRGRPVLKPRSILDLGQNFPLSQVPFIPSSGSEIRCWRISSPAGKKIMNKIAGKREL